MGDHRIVHRHLAEHREHEQRAEQHHCAAVAVGQGQQQRHLAEGEEDERQLQVQAIDQAAHDQLRYRAEGIGQADHHAEGLRRRQQVAQALLEQLRVGHGAGVEHHPAGGGDQRQHAEHPAHRQALAVLATRRGLGRQVRRWLLAHAEEKADAEQDGHPAGQDERRTPTEVRGEKAGKQRGEGDPEVTPHAVDADLAAAVLRVCHQHRGADRVVDRGEYPDQGQPGHQHRYAAGQPGEQCGGADTEEEQQHHPPPAPGIAQPAGRQRTGAEGDETAQRQADQTGVVEVEAAGHAEHGGGEDQHEHVVDDMRGVDEADNGSRSVHGVRPEWSVRNGRHDPGMIG